MMHRDTMLKFGQLFELAKYLGHTQKFQHTGYAEGASSPTLNFGISLFISETSRARKLTFSKVVGIYEYQGSI